MVILVTGATGFIGERLAQALEAAGHSVLYASRKGAANTGTIAADFTRDLNPHTWLPRLRGVEAVINAVGILREQGEQTFDRVHTRAPIALFDACLVAGVRRVIQISALGADTGATRYFTSKKAADEHLAALPIAWTIVRPALVYGPGGMSARLFTMMATLPFVPVPGQGRQLIQPIHVDDLIEAIVTAMGSAETIHDRIALVGPEPITLRTFLTSLRRSLLPGSPARMVSIPLVVMRTAARIAELSRHSLLDRETLEMLEAGNTADVASTKHLLRRLPRGVEAFVGARERAATLLQARLTWLLPVLRVSIAITWIWTAVVSFGLYPDTDSYALLARTGITGALATLSLYGAATLDLAFGLATLLMKRRRLLWVAQIATILTYTVIISIALPEYWLHPYGPVLKNVPLLAAIYLLYSLEDVR